MRKLYIVDTYSDDLGEVTGVFEDGRLLRAWDNNDAQWDHEFTDLLSVLGFDIFHVSMPGLDYTKQLKEYFGVE